MSYQYITISPRTAPLDEVVNANSEYSKGVARDTALAESAPDLLAALKKALTQLDLQHDFDFGKSAPGAAEDSARSEARAAIAKATGA